MYWHNGKGSTSITRVNNRESRAEKTITTIRIQDSFHTAALLVIRVISRALQQLDGSVTVLGQGENGKTASNF